LTDFELEGEILEVVRVEMESRNSDKDGSMWEGEVVIGGELPQGSRWLGDWESALPDDGQVDSGKIAVPIFALCEKNSD